MEVALTAELAVEHVCGVYFALARDLRLLWLRDAIVGLPRNDHWQALGRDALREELYSLMRGLTADVLQVEMSAEDAVAQDAVHRVNAWAEVNAMAVERAKMLFGELGSGSAPDFTMLSVAMRELRALRKV